VEQKHAEFNGGSIVFAYGESIEFYWRHNFKLFIHKI